MFPDWLPSFFCFCSNMSLSVSFSNFTSNAREFLLWRFNHGLCVCGAEIPGLILSISLLLCVLKKHKEKCLRATMSAKWKPSDSMIFIRNFQVISQLSFTTDTKKNRCHILMKTFSVQLTFPFQFSIQRNFVDFVGQFQYFLSLI